MADTTTATPPPAALKPPFSPDIIPIPTESTTTSPTQTSTPNGGVSSQPSQPTQPTASQSALTPDDSLPTISGRGTSTFLVADDIGKFLEHDLDLSRINRIHDHLWMAGRPMRARPLHRYKMMGHEILHTQQMDLHLLKFSNQLMIKPLPEYLLSYTFWESWICANKTFHESASGFLLSYIWLIISPLDLILAQTNYLLPAWISWPAWKLFVKDFSTHIDINALDTVNRRYHFGDLRLGRINSIYRTRHFHTHFVRGYLYGYNRYVVFFERNFSWILVVFVFFSVVLSAMQVGLSIRPLEGSETFRRATYGFVVFSMVSVAVVLGLVGGLFACVFLYNMGAAIRHDRVERRERERLKDKRGTKEA